jgi:hypothetical protein
VKVARPKIFDIVSRLYPLRRRINVRKNGSIVYASDLFEGSISDRAIIEKSGFLDKINPGDLILADRGFTINIDNRSIRSYAY